MSGEEGHDLIETPPFRHCFPEALSCDDDEEDDDNDDALNSSTSTAGPPDSRRTGRYPHLWALGSNASGSPPGSPCRGQTRGMSRQTGSYHTIHSAGRYGNVNRRSLSTASTVASLIGSVPEWSRSFCVFNPGRAVAMTRQARGSMYFGHPLFFTGKRSSCGVGGAGSSLPVAHGTENRHRLSVSYGTTGYAALSTNTGGAAHGFNQSTVSEMRSPSAILAGGQSPSASPLLGTTGHWSWSPQPSMMLSSPSSPTSNSHYYHVKNGGGMMSAPRRELPMLFRSLCCHLALTGAPFISGNPDHPIDARKGPLIGVGGFAKVYAGVDCVSGQLVAIKEINIAEVKDHVALNAIGKEFSLLKSLRHPNIVSYHFFEHSASQKVCRIVMELLTGGSTLSLLQEYGPLCEPILRKFARHILQAIAFIHKEGISHRDIKPANILISHKGDVKLCDFGCSKRVNELSKSTSCIIGTPVYMAPEFIKGEAHHKSDIWSMGCSLFELATGMLPWYHAGIHDNLPLMFYITTSSETPLVLPLQDNVQEFSPDFMNFMELCFTRDVRKRPEATELLNHPWISGDFLIIANPLAAPQWRSVGTTFAGNTSRSSGVDRPLNGGPNTTQSFTCHNDETLLQHEFEDVSAMISVDMCNQWMTMMTVDSAGAAAALEALEAPRLERRLLDAPLISSSAALSSMLGSQPPPSPPFASVASASMNANIPLTLSQRTSLDHAALHDNFSYTPPLGASAGCFVLPSCLTSPSPAVASSQPQYLRINADGSLDFAPAEDDDVELETSDAVLIDEGVANAAFHYNGTPSFNNTYGGSPLCGTGSHLPHVSPVSFSSRSPVGHVRRSVPASHMAQNPSLSLHSSMSFASRVVSPSRRSPTASNASLRTSQQMPSLLGGAAAAPAQASGHSCGAGERSGAPANHPRHAPSSGDEFASAPRRLPLPETVRRDREGRLCMSLTLSRGGPEGSVSIALNIDPEDVQCKYIERRPSYVVAISDDVRTQLATKFQELASSTTSTPRGGPPVVPAARRKMHRFSYGAAGTPSPKSVSPSISPARRPMRGAGGGAFASVSPPKRHKQWAKCTSNSSPRGSCGSPVHSSPTSLRGERRTPPFS